MRVFFFFKQKTAYELRISDWSSDVCSSDLVGDAKLLARIFEKHRVAAVIHFAGATVVPESVAAPLAYYFSNTCKTRNLLQGCVEIGRASCRERVCQYV